MISKINQYKKPIIGNFIYQFFPTLFKELKVERYFSFFFFFCFIIIEIEIEIIRIFSRLTFEGYDCIL